MFRKVIIIMAALILTSLSGCSVDGPVSVIDQDENLRLELVLPKSKYQKDEEITCKAILTYIAEGQTFEIFTGDPVVMFAIDGGEHFRGDLDLLQKGLYAQKIEKDEPVEYPFKKYVGRHLGSDEDAVKFWKEFLAEQQLILPPGKYEILAKVNYRLSPKDRYPTFLTVKHKIRVQ